MLGTYEFRLFRDIGSSFREYGWFGRLWRSDRSRGGSSNSPVHRHHIRATAEAPTKPPLSEAVSMCLVQSTINLDVVIER